MLTLEIVKRKVSLSANTAPCAFTEAESISPDCTAPTPCLLAKKAAHLCQVLKMNIQHSSGSLRKIENPLGKMDGKSTPKNVEPTDSHAPETGYSLVKSAKDEQRSAGSLKKMQNPLEYSIPKNVDTTYSCAPEPGSGRSMSENGSHLDNGASHENGSGNCGNTTNGTCPKDNISNENGANVDDVASPFNGKSSANGSSHGNGTPPIKHTIHLSQISRDNWPTEKVSGRLFTCQQQT